MTDPMPMREEREEAQRVVDSWREPIPEYRLQIYENSWNDLTEAIALALARRSLTSDG